MDSDWVDSVKNSGAYQTLDKSQGWLTILDDEVFVEVDKSMNCWRVDGVTVGSDGNWFLKKYQFANIVTGLL